MKEAAPFLAFAFFAAWLLGLAAIAGRVTPLLLPAGALLIVIGGLFVRDTGRIRERAVERQRRSLSYRAFGGDTQLTPFFGVLMSLVGLIWLGVGIAALAR